MTLAMTMTYLNRRRTVKHLTREMYLGNFDGIVPSLACILEQQSWHLKWKIPLENPGNGISETLNFIMSLDTSAIKNLRLYCEFQKPPTVNYQPAT